MQRRYYALFRRLSLLICNCPVFCPTSFLQSLSPAIIHFTPPLSLQPILISTTLRNHCKISAFIHHLPPQRPCRSLFTGIIQLTHSSIVTLPNIHLHSYVLSLLCIFLPSVAIRLIVWGVNPSWPSLLAGWSVHRCPRKPRDGKVRCRAYHSRPWALRGRILFQHKVKGQGDRAARRGNAHLTSFQWVRDASVRYSG